MNRYMYLSFIVLLGLLSLSACRPGTAPEATLTRTATVAPVIGLSAEPVAEPTTLPPTDPPRTSTSAPPRTSTSAPPRTSTSAPTPSLPLPTSSPPPVESKANADVSYVRAVQGTDGAWTFHVTVQHPDTGWDDYADGWDVVTPDGTVLKPDPDSPFTRLLLHPHVGEQPFTRSQSGIVIPLDASQVRVRAHDLVDGFGGREVLVDLNVPSGEDFEVEGNP